MTVEVHLWSDLLCPWCYLGLRRFQQAREKFEGAIELTLHSFELDPSRSAEQHPELSAAERLAQKYRRTVEEAQGMIDQMRALGAREGVSFHPSGGRSLQSFDAHRLLHLARETGDERLPRKLKERLFRAHWEDAEDLGDRGTLTRLATEVGLSEARVTALLQGDELTLAVREDERLARELGITGVPFFVVGKLGLSGAQSPEVLLRALDQALFDENDADSGAAGSARR